ncbi:uncharacterized protein LOC108599600 [Drosophila busckii]|uniref:uncharacterized protein LOC108599600 n=1 Tax=Drosophila busckii TaxID=30019 RepID=UPI00083EAD5D|nr:uncharacterized protein LOC108599600 [Drosophila busckii]
MVLKITDLNDDCIACILKQVPQDSHLSFSQTCKRFRKIYLDYAAVLYKSLDLRNTTETNFKAEMFLLSQVYKHVKCLFVNLSRKKADEQALEQITKILPNMPRLENLILSTREDEPSTTFACLCDILIKLPRIKGILTLEDNCIVSGLYHFRQYNDFLTEVNESRGPLIEFHDNGTKLRVLTFGDNSLHKLYSNAVRYLGSVKELNIHMTTKATEYAPLAQVPQLKELRISSAVDNDNGSLMPLISAIHANHSQQLISLSIIGPRLNYEETKLIASMKALVHLECDYKESRCLELLTELTHIKGLFLDVTTNEKQIFDELVLNLLQHCRNLCVFDVSSIQLSGRFLNEAYQLLKAIRDPSKQKPLRFFYSNGVFEDTAMDYRDYVIPRFISRNEL